MTFDKFLKRNQMLAELLAEIAARREAVGWVNHAAPIESGLRDVLAAQERLLTAAERLLEQDGDNGARAEVDELANLTADSFARTAPASILTH